MSQPQNDSRLPGNNPGFRQLWEEGRRAAERRPDMFIGSLEHGHFAAVQEPLRLIWEGRVFQPPISVHIQLSPTEFVVRCRTGPLLPEIERLFPWNDDGLINDGWREIHLGDTGQMRKLLPAGNRFGGATGPWLDSPLVSPFHAHSVIFGIRRECGLWCQTFRNGCPVTLPFLLDEPSPVGLVAAAALHPRWFTGLPFRDGDLQTLRARFCGSQGMDESAGLTAEDECPRDHPIEIEWRPDGHLLGTGRPTSEVVRRMVQEWSV